ncbi:MAG: hypothetical protein HN996_12090 [Opitutae bacterium]|jgi:hypothetical protein|nr:hypothetical protein [Opitutae bacterium]
MEITAVHFLVCFIIFNLLLKVVYPISGFLHEVGHAIAGLFLAKGSKISIRFGNYGNKPLIKLGNLNLYIGPTTSFWGYCEFESNKLSQGRLIAIALGGPLVSLVLILTNLWILFVRGQSMEAQFLAAIFFYANCRILIVSMTPRNFILPAPAMVKGESDGLKIIQLLKGDKE